MNQSQEEDKEAPIGLNVIEEQKAATDAITAEVVNKVIEKLPSQIDLPRYIKYGETAIRFEILLTQALSVIYWCSVGEIAFSGLIFLLFLTDPYKLYGTLIHLLHIIRGILGITILEATPSIQELIDSTPLSENVSNLPNSLTEYIKLKSVEYANTNQHQFTSYAVITVICTLLDAWLFIWGLFNAATSDHPGYAETVRLIEDVVLIWINACYFLWAYTLKYSLPKELRRMLVNLIKGNVKKAREFLSQYLPSGLLSEGGNREEQDGMNRRQNQNYDIREVKLDSDSP